MFLLFSIGLKDTMARVRSTIYYSRCFFRVHSDSDGTVNSISVVGVNRSSIMKRDRAERMKFNPEKKETGAVEAGIWETNVYAVSRTEPAIAITLIERTSSVNRINLIVN